VGELTGRESSEGCFARGVEASSISTVAPVPSLKLMDLDADKMSTSVN
jgi:hypothetical protein